MEAQASDEQKGLILSQCSALSWAPSTPPTLFISGLQHTVSHGANWFASYWVPFQTENGWVGQHCSKGFTGRMQPPAVGKPLQGTTVSLGPRGEGTQDPRRENPDWGDLPPGSHLRPAHDLLAGCLLRAGSVHVRCVPHALGLWLSSQGSYRDYTPHAHRDLVLFTAAPWVLEL